jgi:hypothetical protein
MILNALTQNSPIQYYGYWDHSAYRAALCRISSYLQYSSFSPNIKSLKPASELVTMRKTRLAVETFKTLGELLVKRYTTGFVNGMMGDPVEIYREESWRIMTYDGWRNKDDRVHHIEHIHPISALDREAINCAYYATDENGCSKCYQEVPDNVLAIQKAMNL